MIAAAERRSGVDAGLSTGEIRLRCRAVCLRSRTEAIVMDQGAPRA